MVFFLKQFDELHIKLRFRLLESRIRVKGKTILQGRPRALTTEEQLLICLIWLIQYCIEQMLSWMLSIDNPTVNRYNHKIIDILFVYIPLFIFVTAQERIKRTVKFCAMLSTVIR